jgi:hypothetical protein
MKRKRGKQGSGEKRVPSELTKRVKSLWNRDENSARELGEALEDVKKCNPHGGLTAWIKKNLDDSVSTRNRCNYCLRLARGKKPPKGNKGSEPNDKVFATIISEVNEHFKQLYGYAKAGDVDSAKMMATTINQKAAELVEMAKKNEPPAALAKATTA